MRISGISPNFNQNRSVNFGMFADFSTERGTKKILKQYGGYNNLQKARDKQAFEIARDCGFVSIYTDKGSRQIKAQFLNGHTANARSEELIKKYRQDGDMPIRTGHDLQELAIQIWTIYRVENDGTNPDEAYKQSRQSWFNPSDDGKDERINYAHNRSKEL